MNITSPAMDINDLDLNLLRVFHHLMRTGRVAATARELGISQPGVSNALRRLRDLLGDELFVRTARGMQPTPYAAQLDEPVAYALNTLQAALMRREGFDAASSTRNFTIGMSDLGEIALLPALMDGLANAAPGVTIQTVRNATDDLGSGLEAGRVDLAVGLIPQLKTGYFQRRLFLQRYVCLMRQSHPLAQGNLTRKRYFGADHVLVTSQGSGHAKVDEIIDGEGTPRRIRLRVPHFVSLGHILASTDMLATVPERYAQQCVAPFGLVYRPHPVPLPVVGINAFWHARFHRDPASQWLRGFVASCLAS